MAAQLNPDIQLTSSGNDLVKSIDLNRSFNWFEKEFAIKLIQATKEFLNTEFNFYLLAITDQPSMIWKGNDYFVTQVQIVKDIPVYIRLSNVAVQAIMNCSFGERENQKGELQLKNITELEAKILTSYNEFLFNSLNCLFIDKKRIEKLSQEENLEENLIHLTFYIYPNNESLCEAGKIIFSFPEKIAKKPELLPLPEVSLDISQLYKGITEVDIFVGKTKLYIEDLRNLEKEDIVILENSNIHGMTLKMGCDIPFKINPNPKLVINIDTTQEGDQVVNGVNSADLWDSIQVEVGAEFKKVKIPLGELRQMSEGLVIDIAPIVQNEVFLNVGNKKVATGELVIIGDRYGIRLTQIIQETEEDKEEESVQQTAVNKRNDYQEPDDKDTDDSDFDYSDFEIEDDI